MAVRRSMGRLLSAALLVLALGAACSDDTGIGAGDLGGDSPPSGDPPMDGLFTGAVTEVVLEVAYQVGAEPATGGLLGFGDPWDLFEANAEALFAAHAPTITAPRGLSDMRALEDIEGEDFGVADILAIAEAHRQEASTTSRRTFFALWLDGYFNDASGRRETVLGVSIGDTGVIAMFKPVIGRGALRDRVEQTTLVHEFGHAVGLVNRGLPLTSDHHDAENGAHCTNQRCVMYWTVAGPNVVDFVAEHVTDSRAVIFRSECLADVQAASE